jgi:hypothetical protein
MASRTSSGGESARATCSENHDQPVASTITGTGSNRAYGLGAATRGHAAALARGSRSRRNAAAVSIWPAIVRRTGEKTPRSPGRDGIQRA